jgi:GTPase SAR1 family protein
MTDYDFTFKVVLIGESSVKNELINFLFPETIDSAPRLVLNFEFYFKTVNYNGKKIKIIIWDRIAADRFNILLSQVLKGSNGVVIVFKIVNSEFMTNLTEWSKIIRKKAGSIPIILVMLKSEQDDSQGKPREEIKSLVKNYVTNYVELTTRDQKENEYLIQEIVKIILQYHIKKAI